LRRYLTGIPSKIALGAASSVAAGISVDGWGNVQKCAPGWLNLVHCGRENTACRPARGYT